MHRTECFVTSAVGGFKINGPPRIGKGPMSQGNNLGTRDEAFPPKPTQAGRIETCTELVSKAMKCLGNGDKECVTRKIEELIKTNCHDGRLIGKEVADEVRGVFHELWLRSDYESRCELLRMLRVLNVSKKWVRDALRINAEVLDMWFARCGIDWENRMVRSIVVKVIEDLLRDELGWGEIEMCNGLWQFIGVNTDAFRKYVEPCIWLEGLGSLGNLRRPYWLGLRASDLAIEKINRTIVLKLNTTNTIDAIFFPKILSTVKIPGLRITWKRWTTAKYVGKTIDLEYYIDLGINEWPWPIELSAGELERILDGFSNEELAEFIAGMIDGDGDVRYVYKKNRVAMEIAACKDCPKRANLDILKEVIARRFGIVGRIELRETVNVLVFSDEGAVRLLRRIVKYMHHPLRRLRAELILALYDRRISREAFEKLYEMTEYELGGPDIKHNHGLEALTQAAPQTHTHGVSSSITHEDYYVSSGDVEKAVMERCKEFGLVIEREPNMVLNMAIIAVTKKRGTNVIKINRGYNKININKN